MSSSWLARICGATRMDASRASRTTVSGSADATPPSNQDSTRTAGTTPWSSDDSPDRPAGTAFGQEAGNTNTGSENNMFGYYAGGANTGSYNNMMGTDAGAYNSGSFNNFFGFAAGASSTGSLSNFIGAGAGYRSTGNYNEFIGIETAGLLQASATVAVGSGALRGGSAMLGRRSWHQQCPRPAPIRHLSSLPHCWPDPAA